MAAGVSNQQTEPGAERAMKPPLRPGGQLHRLFAQSLLQNRWFCGMIVDNGFLGVSATVEGKPGLVCDVETDWRDDQLAYCAGEIFKGKVRSLHISI